MTSTRWVAGAAAALAIALVLPSTAVGAAPLAPPDRIELPNGWQPEGITSHAKYLYTGSLATGAIWRANSRSGNGDVLARGREGRVAVGVDYDRCRDLIWVAGGATKKVRVHDARTGRVLETYNFRSDNPRFLNDIVVTGKGVYATDSMNQELAVIPFSPGDGCDADVPPASDARTMPLTGDLEYQEGFNLNGIVRSRGRLVTIQSNTGLLFTVNQRTGVTRTIDLGDDVLTQGDGLEIDGDILYAVRNRMNLIAVVDLDDDLASGEVVAELTSDDFDVPTTVTLVRDSLWAVNARFGTEASRTRRTGSRGWTSTPSGDARPSSGDRQDVKRAIVVRSTEVRAVGRRDLDLAVVAERGVELAVRSVRDDGPGRGLSHAAGREDAKVAGVCRRRRGGEARTPRDRENPVWCEAGVGRAVTVEPGEDRAPVPTGIVACADEDRPV